MGALPQSKFIVPLLLLMLDSSSVYMQLEISEFVTEASSQVIMMLWSCMFKNIEAIPFLSSNNFITTCSYSKESDLFFQWIVYVSLGCSPDNMEFCMSSYLLIPGSN